MTTVTDKAAERIVEILLEENEPKNLSSKPNFKTITLLFFGLSLITIIVAAE